MNKNMAICNGFILVWIADTVCESCENVLPGKRLSRCDHFFWPRRFPEVGLVKMPNLDGDSTRTFRSERPTLQNGAIYCLEVCFENLWIGCFVLGLMYVDFLAFDLHTVFEVGWSRIHEVIVFLIVVPDFLVCHKNNQETSDLAASTDSLCFLQIKNKSSSTAMAKCESCFALWKPLEKLSLNGKKGHWGANM